MKQHQLVTKVLQDQIKQVREALDLLLNQCVKLTARVLRQTAQWHGFTLQTTAPG